MPVTNLLKPQVDQPVFEWMRFAPTTTSATSALASSDDKARYFYYVIAQAMWRYDTYSDSWQEVAPPNIAPSTTAALKYSKYSGYRGHTIAATSNTITIAGFGKYSELSDELTIRIIAGKGAGQERTITSVADSVTADFGVVTTAASASIADSTKKWRVNQWDGYQCRLSFGQGQGQIRRVLYNDTTTLYFSDTNHQAVDSFNNTGWSNVSGTPYLLPVTTSGANTHYVIESTVVTVNTPWTVTPDESSIYQILGGGLWLFSGQSSAPFSSLQFYDILSDTWQTKTAIGGHIGTQYGTDFAIDRTGEVAGAFVSGLTGTTAAAYSLTNTGVTMEYDRWANHQIRITSGTGIGQRRRIVGNTNNTFFIDHKWGVTPDNTSQYAVYGDTDKLWVAGNASSAIWQYSVEKDSWANGNITDTGVARNISATPFGATGYDAPHEGYAISGIVYNATGVLSVSVNTAGGTYAIGDLVTLTTTGSNAQAYVTGITGNGAVTSVQLAASGTSYAAAATSSVSGGAGTGLVLNITTGKVGNVTTAATVNHDFRHNEFVTIAGCTTDTSFNNTFQVIGTSSLTTFSIAAPAATASPTAALSQSTSTLVDASQNWNTNELTGKILYILTAGASPTLPVARKIASNTATSITVLGSAITTPTNGTSRYVIQEPRGFGAMCTTKIPAQSPFGWATSGTSTTLVDSSKSWIPNQWTSCRVRIVCGTGTGNESVITSNSATALTVGSWVVATPDATSKYEILDSFGVVTSAGTTTLTDANKNWQSNSLIGKRIRIVAGLGTGSETSISLHTGTVITLAASITTAASGDNGSFYEIYEVPARSTGIDFRWLFNLTNSDTKGRWLISSRGGGSNILDLYDIPTGTWDVSPFYSPMAATLTTGSMYAYDGNDSYFFTKDATGRIYELDFTTFKIHASGITPYAHSTAIIGNRMEVVTTVDGLKYLYIMRHTGQEMWRTLKFW